MKKGMSVKKLAGELKKEFAGESFTRCTCRNKHTAEGWSKCGKAGVTNAIKLAGLPWDSFWSGSAPTPSTQAPEEIVRRAYELAY